MEQRLEHHARVRVGEDLPTSADKHQRMVRWGGKRTTASSLMKPRANSAILSRKDIASRAYFRPSCSSSFFSSAKFLCGRRQHRWATIRAIGGARTHVGLVREQGDECDEKFTAGIEADRVPRASLEFFRAVVQSLHELEHGSGFRLSSLTLGGRSESAVSTYHSTLQSPPPMPEWLPTAEIS